MMRKRFGVPLVLLALFLGVSLIGWSAVFAADLRYISIDTVEKKVDCISGYLEDVHNLLVPNDFKPTLMGQIEADEKGFVETEIVDDPTAATNNIVLRASEAALGASPSPENVVVLTAFIGVLTGDPLYADYTDERCDIAEAYEEPYESEIVPGAREGDYEPWDPDPPDEEEEEGWIYYGKEYDRDEITTRAADRSTNGILYLSDEEIQVSEREHRKLLASGYGGAEPVAAQNGYGGYWEEWLCEESGSVVIPPVIAPYAVGGYGGYGGESGTYEEGWWEYSASGSELIAEDVLPAPDVVIEPDRFYRYTWTFPLEDKNGDFANGNGAPEPSFSTTLYDDNTIMFDYSRDMGFAFWALAGYDTGVIVGLHPGGLEQYDFAEQGKEYYEWHHYYYPQYYDYWDWMFVGEEYETVRESYSYLGGDNHPGPGQPRSDYYMDKCYVDLSEQYGRPLDDIYDENGNLCWLPIMETFGHFSMGDDFASRSSGDDFDLADRFIFFRDYQMVADLRYDEGANNGYGGYVAENFRREETPHKYTVTTGGHDMIVDIDSLDEAMANVIEDPTLLEDIDDYWAVHPKSLDKAFVDGDGYTHVEYTELVKNGAFKPGCADSCHIGNLQDSEDPIDQALGNTFPDPDYPGIEDWPLQWSPAGLCLLDINSYEDYIEAFGDIYRYGLQTVGAGYGGYGGWNQGLRTFTNDDTLDRINSSGFLAYAVQVEEDIVNRKILDLQSMRAVENSVRDAQSTAGIRARDAWFVRTADAQSGRVTKDHNGNWVRSQQYVLRSADNTSVQVVNACLRKESQMSSMVFTTNFGDSYDGDLTQLPWNSWLGTFDREGMRFVYTTFPEDGHPDLLDMNVNFTNPVDESLQETRTFGKREAGEGENFYYHEILSDQLTINDASSFTYTDKTPGANQYSINTNSNGFSYVFEPAVGDDDPATINVSFYVAEDGLRGLDTEAAYPYYAGQGQINDMWDALRVNLAYGSPYVGANNLEINIDNGYQTEYFSQPIDVIYIPMSRMMWKGEAQMPE
ncbi:MAG: hypothetical protein JW883_11005 [Deltaproteobacteria bacterium]|nr:hypothetical protein [Deltaproteobacteria bacterium]